jgi:hypothetical protein
MLLQISETLGDVCHVSSYHDHGPPIRLLMKPVAATNRRRRLDTTFEAI